jgi:D-arabinose 1-dehydrogenase-like Zn-dependent alcohol dehydrogenase
MKMKCVHITGFRRALELVERPVPVPAGSQVLLKVLAAGMCHSDVHIWEGEYDLGGGRTISMAERIRFPLVMGHESAGEAVSLGPDVQGTEIGSKYLVCGWVGCGHCAFCKEGDENLCTAPQFLGVNQDGGYAEYILVPDPRYLIDLKGLDPVVAAPLSCSGLTTFSALKKAGARLHEGRILIIGAGGLGLMALNLLKMMGGKGAAVLEMDPARRAAALQAGAVAAIDPASPGVAEEVRAAIDGPIHFALDLVGSGDTAGFAFNMLDKGGKLVVVGLFGGAMQMPVPMLPSRVLTIQGSYVGSPRELRELVELVQQKQDLVIPIDRRPLTEANNALNDLRQGKVVGRVVLVP